MAVVFEHLGPDGSWARYGPGECAMLEQARAVNPNAVVRLPNLPFEIRFGDCARSGKMPTPPETRILQVNVHNDNSRVVRRNDGAAATVQVRVPPNAVGGCSIQTALPDGRVINVALPIGVSPGQVITVAVPPQRYAPVAALPRPQPAAPTTMMTDGARARPTAGRPSAPSSVAKLWGEIEVRDAPDLVGGALAEGGPGGLVAVPREQGRTVLHKCCAFGRVETLSAIAAATLANDPTGALRVALRDQVDAAGYRGVDHAAERGHADVVRWFVEVARAPVGRAASVARGPAKDYLDQTHSAATVQARIRGLQARDGGASRVSSRIAEAKTLDSRLNDLGDLSAWLGGLDLGRYEDDLRAVAGVDDVRTLACMDDGMLEGVAAEAGMKYGHRIKFLDACAAARAPPAAAAAPPPGGGDANAAILAKLATIEAGLKTVDAKQDAAATADAAAAGATAAALADVSAGLHAIDATTTATQQSVADLTAMLEGVVAATRGQTRLLMDLASGAVDCPKLVWIAREEEGGVKKLLSPSAWYGNKVRVQFLCPVTLRVARCGPDGRGYSLTLPRDWIKKYGVAVNVGLGVLRAAMQVGAVAMGCYHAKIPGMSVDTARLATCEALYEEINKGLDPAEREALAEGKPECKALTETSFQLLKAEIERLDPTLQYLGLVKVVGGAGADLCTEFVHPDVVDDFRAKGAALLKPRGA